MTPNRHGSAVVELPNDLDILVTRDFDAPIALVFEVLTKPEHVTKWFAPPGCEMTKCSIDLCVGGKYHQVFVTDKGIECSFRGTFLEVEPPNRTVETWVFEGRPHLEAIETVELHEAHGVTNMQDEVPRQGGPRREHPVRNRWHEVQRRPNRARLEITARRQGSGLPVAEARARGRVGSAKPAQSYSAGVAQLG